MNTKEKLNLFTDAIAMILAFGVIVGIFYYYFSPSRATSIGVNNYTIQGINDTNAVDLSTLNTSTVISENLAKELTREAKIKYPKNYKELLAKAKTRGFEEGIIPHRLYTKWSDFNDKHLYSRIEEIEDSSKYIEYQLITSNTISKIFVFSNRIGLQSLTFYTEEATNQIIQEMDAWLLSCNPSNVTGTLKNAKEYIFNDFTITLGNNKTNIEYILSSNATKLAVINFKDSRL